MSSPSDSPHTRFRGGPSIIAAALLLFSIGFGILAWWEGRDDLISLIERRIGMARGTTSTETIERLRQVDWRCIFILASAALGVAGLLAQRFGRPVAQRLLGLGLRHATTSVHFTAWIMPLICGVAVFVRYHATLRDGFFRYDDFDFLSFARDYPLKTAIWLPHGDHFFPLTRVLASIAFHLFGTTPWPYNLSALVCFWLTATLGCRLLSELRISYGGQMLFAVLFIFWSPWAEMLAGYYILSIYMLIAALGLATILCYWNWRKKANGLAAFGTALCVGMATLVDTSGWYVPAALAVFLVADFAHADASESLRQWFTRHSRLLIRIGFSVGSSLTVTVLCYTVFSSGLFLSMGEGGQRTLSRLAADFAYLLDVGLLVSLAVPFVYARLPAAMLTTLAVTAFVVFGAFSLAALRLANRRQRTFLIAIALVIAGSALMVNIGRPSEETVVVRWSAKHVCPAYIWLCIPIAMAWHILWSRAAGFRRILLGETTLVLVGGFCLAQTAFGALGLAISFPPFGYPAEIRDAITRRHNVDELQRHVINTITREIEQPIIVPTLDGVYIGSRHPSLFEYNLSRYFWFFEQQIETISWVRNRSMQDGSGSEVATVPRLRDAVSPAFIELLKRDAALRHYYFAEVPLRLEQPGERTVNFVPTDPGRIVGGIGRPVADDALLVESDGRTAVIIQDAPFEPDLLPQLWVGIESDGGDVALGISFKSEFDVGELRGTLHIPAGQQGLKIVDLRQIYAFALSQRVSNLRLILLKSGKYRVHVAALSR